MMNKMKQGNSNVAIAVIAFAAICVGVVGAIVYAGRDPGALITFILAVVPATIGVVYAVKQNDNIQQDVNTVKEQTNGKLDERFKNVNDSIRALSNQIGLARMNGEDDDDSTI